MSEHARRISIAALLDTPRSPGHDSLTSSAMPPRTCSLSKVEGHADDAESRSHRHPVSHSYEQGHQQFEMRATSRVETSPFVHQGILAPQDHDPRQHDWSQHQLSSGPSRLEPEGSQYATNVPIRQSTYDDATRNRTAEATMHMYDQSRPPLASPDPFIPYPEHGLSANARSHVRRVETPARSHPVAQLQGAVSKGRRGRKHRCEHPGCGREFTRKSNLEAHSRKHMTGDRATPYACTHCGRKFKWRSSLKSHEGGCMHQPPMVQFQRQGALAAAAVFSGPSNGAWETPRAQQQAASLAPTVSGSVYTNSQYGTQFVPPGHAGSMDSAHSYWEPYVSAPAAGGNAQEVSPDPRVVPARAIMPAAVFRPETHGMLSSLRLPIPDRVAPESQP